MLARGVAVWALLLVLAILNGAVRQILIAPRLGERAGHIVSTGILSSLTVAFELLGGHYLFGAPWSRLLADYDLARGRVWILVPVVCLVAPLIAARARGL